jgi:hypothetical protein
MSKFSNFFGGIGAWFANAGSFAAMHFKEQKTLSDGKSRAVRALTFLSIAGAVVSAATSLNFTVPITAEVVNSWYGGATTAANITTFGLVFFFAYIIEGGMMIMVPFGITLVGAVIAQQTLFIKGFSEKPAVGGNWFIRRTVGLFTNLIGVLGFLFALLRFKASAIVALAVLVVGLGQASLSMYFSWNGNGWKAEEVAGDLRPTVTTADVLATNDTLKRKSFAAIKDYYKGEIASVTATAKTDKANAVVKAKADAAEARALVMKKYGADFAAGNRWAANQISTAFAGIKKDSLATIEAAAPAVKIAALKLKRDGELSGDSLSFATLSAAKVLEVKDGGDRFASKRDAVAMLWQWLGLLATPFFVLCCLISALIKGVDFQALSNAVGAAVGSVATAKSAAVATAINTSGNLNYTIPAAIVTNTNTKPRDAKGRTLGEVGSDIADSLARLNGAVKQGNAKSAKTNAINLANGLADYLGHPEHYSDAIAMAALDAKLVAMEATAKKNGWTVYTEDDINDIANS